MGREVREGEASDRPPRATAPGMADALPVGEGACQPRAPTDGP